MSVHIQLKLFANLREYGPDETDRLTIESGQSIREVLTDIGLPAEKAKLIFINGTKGDLDTVLKGGERVGLFPPVAGG
jgi:molybdopterin converting factor small subunit